MHIFFKKPLIKRTLTSCIAVILFFSIAPFSLAAPKPSKSYEAARNSYYSLIKSNQKKKQRHNWETAIAKFLAVANDSNNPKAPDATFMVAELYRMLYPYSNLKSDLNSAIQYYEKVAKNYPNNSLANDSIYKVGEIYENKLNDYDKAYAAYYKVAKEFKKSDMTSKANSKLIKIKQYAPKNNKESIATPPSNLILVNDIKYWSENDSVRIVIYPAESLTYKENYIKKDKKRGVKPRIYIDLYNAFLSKKLPAVIDIKDGLLTSIRSNQHDKEIVRVVLDIQSIKNYRIFTFEDPFRIVIDITGENQERQEQASAPKKEPESSNDNKVSRPATTAPKNQKVNYTLAKQLGLNVKRIVIDPGHGGKDPGAIGIDDLKEADVTLEISEKLKDIIEENLECEVVLTRDGDDTLSLEERTAIAKKVKADLFISIHTNASEKGNATGIETYFLNFATDERTMATAARENATSKLAISDLEEIIKIIKYSNIQESKELAHKVQKAIIRTVSEQYKDVKNLGVKQAPFYVLFGARKPSILIETSFIDNKTEGKRLQDDKYIDTMALAIFNGINEYIDGLLVASNK